VRLFALDQNFPQPIVDGLRDWLEPQVKLVPIARIDNRLATRDDWEILLTLDEARNDELLAATIE
jgi:hypothetical protein